MKNLFSHISPAKSNASQNRQLAPAEVSVTEVSVGEADAYDVPSDEETTTNITKNMASFVQK